MSSDQGRFEDAEGVVRAMLPYLDREELAEVERAARLTALRAATTAELRIARLGYLRQRLATQPPDAGLKFPIIRRTLYDEARPPDAPSSESLVAEFGSWTSVCHLASGLT